MAKIPKKAWRLMNAAFGSRLAYGGAFIIDMITPAQWNRAPITVWGNYNLRDVFPKLALPIYRLRSGLFPTPLCLSMAHYGSDKGLSRHNYTCIYDAIFASKRTTITRLFELGIGTTNVTLRSHMGKAGSPGASLRAWREYFFNARIFAADIDRNALFSEHRIACFQCDQTDPESVKALWVGNPELAEPFDIIIDDGLHEFNANRCFLENSFTKLRAGGIFIIEDILTSHLPVWRNYLEQFATNRGLDWAVVEIYHPFNTIDNNIVFLRKRCAN
jgi:SAM-dependent methyltransferase